MPTYKTIHIAKSHQSTRKPKLGKEYGFSSANGQTERKKASKEHCISVMRTKVLNLNL